MFPCSDFISSYLLLIRTHMDRALTHSRRFISEWSCNWSVGIGCIEAITPRKWWNCPVGNRLQLEKPGPQSVSLTSNMDQLLPCNSRSINMQYSQSPCNSSSSPGALFRVWAIVFHPSFALHWWWWWWWWHNGYLPKLSMSMIEHKRLTVRNCHEESISIQTLVVENCKWWHALFAIDFQKHSTPESRVA